MEFFSYVNMLLPALLQGLGSTLKLFILTLVFAIPLGLPFALGSISKFYPFKVLSKGYIWIFRGTPLLLQLFFIYYGLPSFGIVFDRFPAAVITFTLNYAAYFAEIYRAGILSIDKGQYEAARCYGFTRFQTMYMIIIPQTIKRIIPPMSNETITLIKDTALVTAIGVAELLKVAKDAVNRDVNTTAYGVVAIMYLILTFVLTIVSKKIEDRYSRHEQ